MGGIKFKMTSPIPHAPSTQPSTMSVLLVPLAMCTMLAFVAKQNTRLTIFRRRLSAIATRVPQTIRKGGASSPDLEASALF
jgi:hypothetical protein